MVFKVKHPLPNVILLPCFKEQIPYFGTAKIDDNLKNKKIFYQKFSLFCSKPTGGVFKQFRLKVILTKSCLRINSFMIKS